jgi:hypothetical protein
VQCSELFKSVKWLFSSCETEIRFQSWTETFLLYPHLHRLLVPPFPRPEIPLYFSRCKAGEAWCWLFTSIWSLNCKCENIYLDFRTWLDYVRLDNFRFFYTMDSLNSKPNLKNYSLNAEPINKDNSCRIWGSHNGDYEEFLSCGIDRHIVLRKSTVASIFRIEEEAKPETSMKQVASKVGWPSTAHAVLYPRR